MTSSSNRAGSALGALLKSSGTSQSALSRTIGTSQGYISEVIGGKKLPNAEWIDLVADSLGMSLPERAALHRMAARDHGFKIDLT